MHYNTNPSLLPFQKALDTILSYVKEPVALATESCLLPEAAGRILAEALISPISVPSFNNSAMDGYAIRLSDLDNLGASHCFPVAGIALAGHAFTESWPIGSCVRIMTGAAIPSSADAVIMQEYVTVNERGITCHHTPKKGENIRFVGEDIRQNSTILEAGHRLDVTTLPLLASLGIDRIAVYRKLKVAIFSTGDELQEIGTAPLKPGYIYDSNRLMLQLALQKLGCDVINLGIIADDHDAIEYAFKEADKQADVILSSGGVSVGDADYTQQVLAKLGSISFWKVAMKPGKPLAFGKLHSAFFFGLPGNSVSATVTLYQLVQPFLMKLSGYQHWKTPIQYRVKTTEKIKKKAGRTDFQRAILLTNSLGELEVTPNSAQGSHIYHSLHTANCFIILEQERGNVEKGEWVTVSPFNVLLKE